MPSSSGPASPAGEVPRAAGPATHEQASGHLPHRFAPGPAETTVLLAAAVIASLAWLLCAAARPEADRGPVGPRSEYVHRISITRAGESELALLPGIGLRRAQRIARARASAGPSASAGEILLLAGLPRAMWGDIQPWLAEGE